MSITINAPAGAGPDEPPAPVSLVKAAPATAPEVELSWAERLKARLLAAFAEGGAVREHSDRARTNTWAWVTAEKVTDAQLAEEILQQRQTQHATREKSLRDELSKVARQLVEHKVVEARQDAAMRSASGHHTDGHEHGRHRDSMTDASLRRRKEELEVLLEEHGRAVHLLKLEPTAAEIGRARWGRRTFRASALVGSVVGGGVMLPMQDMRWLLASLPAAAVALWRAGMPIEEQADADVAEGGTVVPAQAGPGGQPGADQSFAERWQTEGPALAAVVAAARQAAEAASSPGAVAAREVTQAAEQAAQVQGAADLITALLKAGIIARGEEEETRIIGVIRPDGPGWTATIELPGGKPAAHAIGRDTELASALKVKAPQLQLAADTSEDGHEGRFVIWCANSANPYAGPMVMSELIGASSWDFWTQGVPLGTNARGVRKVLNMIWSSLLIGGLMNYGKSYLARLIASAAALDPYVKIVLLTGKTGADWAALKLVADSYVSGNSPAAIREMHEVMEETIAEMSEHGERLERLFESDPNACPEGKITPGLAKTKGLELTLLIVEELQEILDAAAGMKLVSADDADDDGEGGRKPAGRNGKEVMVSLFARFIRVARYVGGMEVVITQRPDSTSVPTLLREVAPKRACYRVKGRNSSKMVLGEDAVDAGAAPHLLMEHHKGVVVLDEGGEEGHDTVRADVINLDDFRLICERGRDLRLKAGTLSGQAAERWEKEREGIRKQQVIRDAIAAMDANGVDRARLVVLVGWMAELSPERWHGLTETSLGQLLRDAGAGNTTRIGAVDGLAKASGYTRDQLASALADRAA